MITVAPEYYQGHLVYAHKTPINAQSEREHLDGRHLALIEALTSQGARVLDIGCGSGAFVAHARATGRDAYGIDFNAQEIDLGRMTFHLSDYLMAGDVFTMSPDWADFDLITMFEVIEHLPNPTEVIQEVYRRLKRGGYLILSCPNEKRWMPAGRVFVDYPPHHLTRWSPQSLRQLLKKNSFEHVRTEIDASVRDIIWTAYVNRRSKRISVDPGLPSQEQRRLSEVKWLLDRVLRMLCVPFDNILRAFHVGTMGMRVVVKKVSS